MVLWLVGRHWFSVIATNCYMHGGREQEKEERKRDAIIRQGANYLYRPDDPTARLGLFHIRLSVRQRGLPMCNTQAGSAA